MLKQSLWLLLALPGQEFSSGWNGHIGNHLQIDVVKAAAPAAVGTVTTVRFLELCPKPQVEILALFHDQGEQVISVKVA